MASVYRFLLTPRWWGINIFAVLAIPVCLFMGSWQLSRFDARVENHQERQEYSAEAEQAQAKPLRDLLPVTDESVDRTARVEGRYDTGHPLLVPDRRLDEQQGSYVLDLLLPKGGGKAVPVVRGWLPGEPDASDVPPPERGEVTVEGVLQAPESHDRAGREAQGALPEGQLGFVSPAPLINLVPYEVESAWLTVQETEGKLRPVPPAAADNTGLDMKAFQNLGYTAEWFVFAGFVVFMWFRLFRREAELVRDAELGLHPGDGGPAGGTPPGTPRPVEPPEGGGESASPAEPANPEPAGRARP